MKTRTKRQGPFDVEIATPDPTSPADFREALLAHTPRARLERLRPLVDQLNAGQEDLAEAERLLDRWQESEKVRRRFDNHMNAAWRAVTSEAHDRRDDQIIPLAMKGKDFTDRKRGDTDLTKEMINTYQIFMKQRGRRPSTKELWHALPLNDLIQEKDELDLEIWEKGKEKPLKFTSFQARYTKVKKYFPED